MSKENNGGPAYPTQGYEGLTVRDYFAAKAMQGWLASYPESEQHPVATHRENMVAELSYLMADAMLKAREKL
ncbi:TPA: hypothetical protein RFM78_003436 [Klebsiella pneumoniae subsp. pneumoniae]|uniref:hypothetical protein n=1 Tax=Klebsiella pneumoniae complex TaxID=3390273 RepID=UPI000E35558E|nr:MULTISPECIES: hypothetical protein [Klebsiella]HDU3882163.1 hypothetical protein [Klebsiella pneumoniae subsp. pneumoniae]MBK2544498.1 hypothetical protein [Klebsiella variicola]WNN08713.1 hypothetical protein RJT51_09345 [Klebsiella variicola]HBW9592032.1 hypothetical protein [Klebsiella pneumoniae]HBW9612541.1 hypothetical protein [Klebsiella pneumoniae]